jgi:hypothetical protein
LDVAADDYSPQRYFHHGNKKNFTRTVQAVKVFFGTLQHCLLANEGTKDIFLFLFFSVSNKPI